MHLRFLNYFNLNFLEKSIINRNSLIYRALLRYGHNNLDLEILEYCDNKYRIKQEQYYLDLFKPEYNILKIAGSAPPPFRFSYEGGGG